jgi:lysophospholipase L1-like esterase
MYNSRAKWLAIIMLATILVLCLAAILLVLRKSGSIKSRIQAYLRPQSSMVIPVITAPVSGNHQQLAPKTMQGIGIMGDSNSDEYRADDNRGGEYADTTLNWVEQLSKSRNLNFGEWGTWGEPRRTGFEYNWARSGATAQSLIDDGQATGLAQQVAEGKVTHVILFIGSNDFHLVNGTYKEIYTGSLRGAALQAKIEALVENMALAVDTVNAAGPVNMVIANISDPGLSAAALQQYPDPNGRQRVTDAINTTNQAIAQMAQARGIPVVDLIAYAHTLFSRVDQNGNLLVGGEKINVLERGNEPHHLQLDDSSGHPGTVASGLIANLLLVEPFDKYFSAGITPLSDNEILENAGIMPKIMVPAPNIFVPLP